MHRRRVAARRGAASLAPRRRIRHAGAQAVQARVARIRRRANRRARRRARGAGQLRRKHARPSSPVRAPSRAARCSSTQRVWSPRPARRCCAAAPSSRARRRTRSRGWASRRCASSPRCARETGLPVVTEVMDTRQVDLVAEHADMLQIGARNMQNFALLAELGRVRTPGAAQARSLGDDRRAAHRRRVHHGQRQPRRRAVRTRHPHVRDGDAQHARPRRDPRAQARVAPAGDRRSESRGRRCVARRAARVRGDRRRRRRAHRRGSPRPRARVVGRRSIPRAAASPR